MRNSALWVASILMAMLVFEGFVVAQPPPGRGRPPGPGGRLPASGLERAVDDLKLSKGERDTALAAVRAHQENVRGMTDLAGASLLLKLKGILSLEDFEKLQKTTDKVRVAAGSARRPTVDDVVERILSFDKNKDGKVTKDELPERLQYLLEKGDTNKDGALDRDEIKKLAAELANDRSLFGGGPGRGGPGGPGGRGRPGGPGGPGGPFGPGIAGSGLSFGVIERAVDDLKLSEEKKEKAAAAVKSHKEDARKLTELARAGLLLQMSEVLKKEELEKFKVVLDRQPGVGDRPAGPAGPAGRGRPPRPRE